MAESVLTRPGTDVLRRATASVRDAYRRVWLPASHDPAEHWQRIVLNREVRAHLQALDPPTKTAAEISGRAQAALPWKRFVSLSFPEFDLCAPLDGHERYDVVICEQVLEHVVDPVKAAANLRGLTNPGGRVVVSTPFLVRVHEVPMWAMNDYWRFTPRGLRTLLTHAGLEVDHVDSWGNRSAAVGNFYVWPGYRRWHSLRNEPNLPVQVWAFARNPS